MNSDQDWIDAFIEVAHAERSAALNTCAAYRRDLEGFSKFLSERNLGFASVARQDIECYLSELAGLGIAATSRARKLSAIRQMYRFAFEEGWRTDMPAQDVSHPKLPKPLPGTLSLDEVEAMLAAAQNHGRNPSDALRNACMLELLYATGMRVSELVELPVASVRGNPQIIVVKGKGGKERMVPLSAPCARSDFRMAFRPGRERAGQTQKGGAAIQVSVPVR